MEKEYDEAVAKLIKMFTNAIAKTEKPIERGLFKIALRDLQNKSKGYDRTSLISAFKDDINWVDEDPHFNESTQYDKIILESNKWMYGENSSLNEASAKKKVPYVHKGNSSFTIKKIEDTYGTDKLLAQAEFKVYASLFESSKNHEGSKTSNLSTTLMDKKAFKSNLKDGKFITLKGDPADDGYKRKVLDKDFSKVLADVKELRSDYLKGK